MTEAHPDLSGQDQDRRGQEAEDGGQDPGQRGNKWWTLVAVCLGTFMLLLDITIVNVALPDIQRALNSSFSDLQWVVDAYALTPGRVLADRRQPGGHVRPPPALPDRPGGVHLCVGAVRLCRQHADAAAIPRLAGSRRGDHVRGVAGAAG